MGMVLEVVICFCRKLVKSLCIQGKDPNFNHWPDHLSLATFVLNCCSSMRFGKTDLSPFVVSCGVSKNAR